MRAMVLTRPHVLLEAVDVPAPQPGPGQVLLRVCACGVCRTDLHVIDGELPALGHRVIPGHEIVGRVVSGGSAEGRFRPGERVGIPWLGWTCGVCDFCRSGKENLCDRARFTGYHIDGGYAELLQLLLDTRRYKLGDRPFQLVAEVDLKDGESIIKVDVDFLTSD